MYRYTCNILGKIVGGTVESPRNMIWPSGPLDLGPEEQNSPAGCVPGRIGLQLTVPIASYP